jgi:tetratricopeptide (TPR) repeat protein
MTPRKRSKVARAGAPARKTARRWRVAPPLVHGREPLEGGSVLLEAEGAWGIAAWQSLRDVTLWAMTPPEARAELFAGDAAERRLAVLRESAPAAALAEGLTGVLAVVHDPVGADPEAVARACGRVAEWAEARGARATALAFVQARALVLPDDPAAAYAVGIAARRAAEYGRAETWRRRAVMLARQQGDWQLYSLAFVGLGNLNLQRGNFPVARKLHLRARRTARRYGHRPTEGMALHDLFVIAKSTGQLAEADAFAASALRAYGPTHPRLPALAHDVAYAWLEQGYFARALPVFEAVLPRFAQPSERVRVLADIGRAAAGIDRADLFDRAWQQTTKLAARRDAAEGAAQAMLDLAHGAAMLGEWERAEEAAVRALEIATSRGQGKIRLTAESVLESVRRGRTVAPAAPPAAPASTRADELAHAFVACLSAV